MGITSAGSYFEDFTVGDTLVHFRGRTITETDNHMFTSLVMNTAQLHFNQDMVDKDPKNYYDGRRVVYGGVVLAFVVGLASEDTSENALAELEMDTASTPTRCSTATRSSRNRPCSKSATATAPTLESSSSSW